MASSSAKKRPKARPFESSSSSSNASLKWLFLWEPPDDLFPSKAELLRLFVAISIAVSIFLSLNFFANSFANRRAKRPFCDSSLGSWNSLPDHCEPCPQYGQCYDGKLECDRGYRKYGNLCTEDGDINQTAKKLSDWVQFRLCESNAQYMCFGSGMIWVLEDDIWNGLDEHKLTEHTSSDSYINNYTKQKAMETIVQVLEIRKNSLGVNEFKCPDFLAESYRPLSCRINQWLFNNLLLILPTCVLLLGFVWLIWKVRQRLCMLKRVEQLYQQVCEILEENASMSNELTNECEPWVVASRLRDHLLSPKERRNLALWKKVEELVQEDSRVDRYPKLVKGESKVVWEWQVEGSLSSTRTKNKGEASKIKSTETTDLNSNQRRQRNPSKVLIF